MQTDNASTIRANEWREIASLSAIRRHFGLTRQESGRHLARVVRGLRLDDVRDQSSFGPQAFILLSQRLGRAAIIRRNLKGQLIIVAPPELAAACCEPA